MLTEHDLQQCQDSNANKAQTTNVGETSQGKHMPRFLHPSFWIVKGIIWLNNIRRKDGAPLSRIGGKRVLGYH
jgi:hypothetical protein